MAELVKCTVLVTEADVLKEVFLNRRRIPTLLELDLFCDEVGLQLVAAIINGNDAVAPTVDAHLETELRHNDTVLAIFDNVDPEVLTDLPPQHSNSDDFAVWISTLQIKMRDAVTIGSRFLRVIDLATYVPEGYEMVGFLDQNGEPLDADTFLQEDTEHTMIILPEARAVLLFANGEEPDLFDDLEDDEEEYDEDELKNDLDRAYGEPYVDEDEEEEIGRQYGDPYADEQRSPEFRRLADLDIDDEEDNLLFDPDDE